MSRLLFLFACSQPPAPTASDPAAPAAAVAATLAPWEAEILAPTLEDLRAGVRTAGEQPFGVCEGKRDCERYIGPDAGLLPEGAFFVRSEVKVPSVGEGWQVAFKAHCVSTDAKGTQREQDHEKTYEVKYTGKDRTYRLQPLWKIQSPHPGGARSCDFSLTPLRPDGQPGETLTGHYETPAPAADEAAPTPTSAAPARAPAAKARPTPGKAPAGKAPAGKR
ncbi:MAG: hypothetical protein ABIO70_06070 [Pseudomonadota bacterium]